MKRIIFFSKQDLASHTMMNKVNEILASDYKPVKMGKNHTVNDILELHHICEYIENGFVHPNWDSQKIQNCKNQIKEFKKLIGLYMAGLSSEQIIGFYNDIDFDYRESFWLLVNRHKIYEKISIETLHVLFKKKRFRIDDILHCSRVVLFFESEIRKYLMSDEKNAEILLGYYEMEHDREQKEKFFPKAFSLKDKEDLIDRYLDTQDVNLNYVRLVQSSKDSEFLRISDKLRLKAKRLAKKLNDELLDDANAIVNEKTGRLSEQQNEMENIFIEGGRLIYSYSSKRLKEKTTKPDLFKNFRTVFGFVDFQGCIYSAAKSSRIDPLEHTFMRSKNEFLISFDFQDRILTGELKFELYRRFLTSIPVSIGELLQHFVNDYLNMAFKVDTFKLYLPNPSDATLGKIRLIVPEFESLVEQYRLYVLDGCIDYDLLQVTTKTNGFEKIPSCVKKKYVYPLGKEYAAVSHHFFSRNSILYNYVKYGKKYSCFYQLIVEQELSLEDFENYEKQLIQQFVDKSYLHIDPKGALKPKNVNFLTVIRMLRDNDVLSYYYFSENIRNEIDEMEKQKLVVFSGALFAKAECDLFNYYLNNRFSNGLWLRNKYVHATNSHDEEEQKNDYRMLLQLLVLLVLKIEDDLRIQNHVRTLKAKQS